MIAGATFKGSVVIWDVSSGRELKTIVNHTRTCYCIAWNQVNKKIYVSTSSDCYACVVSVDVTELSNNNSDHVSLGSRKVKAKVGQGRQEEGGESVSSIVAKFLHPAPVFGCSWCPFNPDLFSTCCEDGVIRIFNCIELKLFYKLQGHSSRTFNCEWSKLVPVRILIITIPLIILFHIKSYSPILLLTSSF